MKGKRLVSLMLALALAVPAHAQGGAEPFPAVNTYPGYADVAETDWFYDNAKLCYEIGIMTGTDKGFEPNKVLTQAECVALAARVGSTLRGETIRDRTAGEAWWVPYNEYLFPDGGSIDFPDHAAGRWQFLILLYDYVEGAGLLTPINNISKLPDTDLPDEAVALKYYNAGILTGVDKYGTLGAWKSLTRAEAAAMVSRIARPELRQSFTPADSSSDGAGQSADDLSAERFAREYLGGDADKIYAYAGDAELTALDFTVRAMTLSRALILRALQSGQEFAWDAAATTSGLNYVTYIRLSATYAGLEDAWKAKPLDTDAYQRWADSGQVWKAKHILVEDKTTADVVYDAVKDDVSQFDPLLAVYGTDPGMESNPEGYVFGPGEMVAEFENAVKATAVGAVSQPVESQFGWHVILRLPLTQEDYLNNGFGAFWDDAYEKGQASLCTDAFSEGINFTIPLDRWLNAQ